MARRNKPELRQSLADAQMSLFRGMHPGRRFGMSKVLTKGESKRGEARVWLQGRWLEELGFEDGRTYRVILDARTREVRLVLTGDPKARRVSHDKQGRPIIDLTSQALTEALLGADKVVVETNHGELVIRPESVPRLIAEREVNGLEGSVFSGAGFLTEAARLSGYEAAWGVEIEERNATIYAANHPGAVTIALPVEEAVQLNWQLHGLGRPILTRVEFLTGGIPCQPFSRGWRSKKQGETERQREPKDHELIGMTHWFLSVVQQTNPLNVLVEQVEHYLESESYAVLASALSVMGYFVRSTVIDSRDLGSVAGRRRAVVVATTSPHYDWPQSLPPQRALRDLLYAPEQIDAMTAAGAFGATDGDGGVSKSEKRKHPRAMGAWFSLHDPAGSEGRTFGPGAFLREKWKRAGFKPSIVTLGTAQVEGVTEPVCAIEGRVGAVTKGYHKVRPESPYVAHPGNRGTPQRPDRGDLYRMLTVDEVKRLHGVPESYQLPESYADAIEVLGQGVIVDAFQRVIAQLPRTKDGALVGARPPQAVHEETETDMSNPYAPGENLYTCRHFTSGGYAIDCEKQARGEGDQPPRGWVTPGRFPAPTGHRRYHAFMCRPCARYGRELAERRSRGLMNPPEQTGWAKCNPPEQTGWAKCNPPERAQVIAKRLTADGVAVELWSDGPVTGRMGYALDGVPIARPKNEKGLEEALRAGWLFMGEVELYDAADAGALYAASRHAARRGLLPGDVRARFADAQRPVLHPTWEVYQADRDGRATLRVWKLPRMRWPGLAVWDHVSAGARGARYEIVSYTRDGVASTTGVRFNTLRELTEHLLGDSRGLQNPPACSSCGVPHGMEIEGYGIMLVGRDGLCSLCRRELYPHGSAEEGGVYENPTNQDLFREHYPDGRMIPQAGDRVFQTVRGPFGTIHGEVYKARGGAPLRVRITGSASAIVPVAVGGTTALTPQWSVADDPWFAGTVSAAEMPNPQLPPLKEWSKGTWEGGPEYVLRTDGGKYKIRGGRGGASGGRRHGWYASTPESGRLIGDGFNQATPFETAADVLAYLRALPNPGGEWRENGPTRDRPGYFGPGYEDRREMYEGFDTDTLQWHRADAVMARDNARGWDPIGEGWYQDDAVTIGDILRERGAYTGDQYLQALKNRRWRQEHEAGLAQYAKEQAAAAYAAPGAERFKGLELGMHTPTVSSVDDPGAERFRGLELTNPYSIRYRQKKPHVVSRDPMYAEPVEIERWWPVNSWRGPMPDTDIPEESVTAGLSGSGAFFATTPSGFPLTVFIDPQANAVHTEERPIPKPPRSKRVLGPDRTTVERGDVMWRDGRWLKMTAKGWRDA